jgi:hypothetical protein
VLRPGAGVKVGPIHGAGGRTWAQPIELDVEEGDAEGAIIGSWPGTLIAYVVDNVKGARGFQDYPSHGRL